MCERLNSLSGSFSRFYLSPRTCEESPFLISQTSHLLHSSTREVCRDTLVETAACRPSVTPTCAWWRRHFVLNYVAVKMTWDSGMLPSGVTTFPYQHKHWVILPATPPSSLPIPSSPGSFSLCLFLHLLPRDTLIVPTAINTSLSMWQPCVPQSPSQPSHWLPDCEKLQQVQDPHIHMEIWVYKYRAEAEEKAAQTQLALQQ